MIIAIDGPAASGKAPSVSALPRITTFATSTPG